MSEFSVESVRTLRAYGCTASGEEMKKLVDGISDGAEFLFTLIQRYRPDDMDTIIITATERF